MYNQKLAFDALHLTPLTLNAIHGVNGGCVVSLKANQVHRYRYCLCTCLINKAEYGRSDAVQRGHGRIEQRNYFCFRMSPLALALHWKDAGIVTLIRVQRIRQTVAGGQLAEEVSYFLSDLPPVNQNEADELFDAIRQHWRIEAIHRRDVTLAEDALRTANQATSRLMDNFADTDV